MAFDMNSSASRVVLSGGAKPPSSPTPVLNPFFFKSDLSWWYTSDNARTVPGVLFKPSGIIMNSWIESPLEACAPPLITLQSGIGISRGFLKKDQTGVCLLAARALKKAMLHALIAFAPNRCLFLVVSCFKRKASNEDWLSKAILLAFRNSVKACETALATPLP